MTNLKFQPRAVGQNSKSTHSQFGQIRSSHLQTTVPPRLLLSPPLLSASRIKHNHPLIGFNSTGGGWFESNYLSPIMFFQSIKPSLTVSLHTWIQPPSNGSVREALACIGISPGVGDFQCVIQAASVTISFHNFQV